MNENVRKIVGIDRRPYRPPLRERTARTGEEFRAFMVRFWRRSLIVLSVVAVVGHGAVIGFLIWAGSQGMGNALAAVLATCFLLGFAYSGFAFFTRRPPEFRHYHHHRHETWQEVDRG